MNDHCHDDHPCNECMDCVHITNEQYHKIILDTRRELASYDHIMRCLIGKWNYNTIQDAITMRSLITNKYKDIPEYAHPILDYNWYLLRRLTNCYHRYLFDV